MFIHEEIIVAGGGDMSYAELVQLGRHFRRRFRIAAFQAAVLTPILWTGFLLFNNSVSVGFWEALNWREIIGFWEVSKWGKIVGLWAVVTFLGLIPKSFWDMLDHP